MMGQNEPPRPGEFVTALARGLDVLACFEPDRRRMTLSEVANRVALSRGTSRRLLLTLGRLGFVESDGKLFWLTPKILSLANSYLTSFGIGDPAKAILKKVAETLNESCSIGVLEGPNIVYIARADAPRSFATTKNLTIGSRLPAYCTSLGRVLLASLDSSALEDWISRYPLVSMTDRTITQVSKLRSAIEEARQQGYAIVNGETEVGLRSIAVPVINRSKRVIAALNASTLVGRTSLGDLRKTFLPVIRGAAMEVAKVLEHH